MRQDVTRCFEGVLERFSVAEREVIGTNTIEYLSVEVGPPTNFFENRYGGGYYDSNSNKIRVFPEADIEDTQCCNPCWSRFLNEQRQTFAHELGHHLAHITNPTSFSRRKNWFLGELIADLYALQDFASTDEYREGRFAALSFQYEKSNAHHGAASVAFYEDHSKDIRYWIDRLIKDNPLETAKIIDPYKAHLSDRTGIPPEFNYGICIKETNQEDPIPIQHGLFEDIPQDNEHVVIESF